MSVYSLAVVVNLPNSTSPEILLDTEALKNKLTPPDNASVPLVPEEPEVPELPLVPEVPSPEVPLVPEVPVSPEVPEVPEMPEVPEVPEVPDVLDVPPPPVILISTPSEPLADTSTPLPVKLKLAALDNTKEPV